MLYMCHVQSPEEDYFSVHIRVVGDWTGTWPVIFEKMYTMFMCQVRLRGVVVWELMLDFNDDINCQGRQRQTSYKYEI